MTLPGQFREMSFNRDQHSSNGVGTLRWSAIRADVAPMFRKTRILIPLLICAAAIPAEASAQERTIPPTTTRNNVVEYRVVVGDNAKAKDAWLKGPSGTHQLRLAPLRRSLARHRVRIHLSPAIRRGLGGPPQLVINVAPPVSGGGAGSQPESGQTGGPATQEHPTVGLSQGVPVESNPIPSDCTRYASPGGSDSADGSREAPFATAQKLVDTLGPGDVGCLDAGTYQQGILAIRNSGTATERVVLRSTPGQRALIEGQIWIVDSANFATVAYVDNDATTTAFPVARPSPVVNGDDALFYGMNVYSQNTVCFFLGDREWGTAYRTVIRHNRIHNCGEPGTNHRHGIYMADAVDAVIEENAIYDNPDRGIQLYPYSQGAIIRHNVIDSNGEGVDISGDHGYASNGNLVEGNVITNSKLSYNIRSWWPEGNPVGYDNVVRGNCIGGGFGAIEEPEIGFAAHNNIFTVPTFRDHADKNFSLPTGSPCADVMDEVNVG